MKTWRPPGSLYGCQLNQFGSPELWLFPQHFNVFMHRNLQRGFETFEERIRLKQIKQGEPLLLTSVEGKQHETEWLCDIFHAQVHHFIHFCAAVIAAVCLHFVNRRNVLTEPRHICQESGPWRTESASDIPPLTGEEVRVWVRTGRRRIEGKGVVQGSWRPRYWTGFMLCKVNRIWMDRTCDPLQVLMNEWSVISLLHNVWLWMKVQVILASGTTFLDHHYIHIYCIYIYIYKGWSIFSKKTSDSELRSWVYFIQILWLCCLKKLKNKCHVRQCGDSTVLSSKC